MPEISRFYGIVIRMFFADHNPPHFHNPLGIIEGSLPPRVMGMVSEWAALHRDELLSDWQNAQNKLPLEKIAPLA